MPNRQDKSHEQRSTECMGFGEAISNITLELKPWDWITEQSPWRVRVGYSDVLASEMQKLNRLQAHQKGRRIGDRTRQKSSLGSKISSYQKLCAYREGRRLYWMLLVKKPKISAIWASETHHITPDMPNQDRHQTLMSTIASFVQCTVLFLVLRCSPTLKYECILPIRWFLQH